MTDFRDFDQAKDALSDPELAPPDLAAIAVEQPLLRVLVAQHPRAYPPLLEWLDKFGGPDAAQAVKERRAGGGARYAVVPEAPNPFPYQEQAPVKAFSPSGVGAAAQQQVSAMASAVPQSDGGPVAADAAQASTISAGQTARFSAQLPPASVNQQAAASFSGPAPVVNGIQAPALSFDMGGPKTASAKLPPIEWTDNSPAPAKPKPHASTMGVDFDLSHVSGKRPAEPQYDYREQKRKRKAAIASVLAVVVVAMLIAALFLYVYYMG